jgi:(2R)-ethylmalonyl-CoA mutase
MKERLVESNALRLRRIETGEQIVVGVNRFLESEPSPLSGGPDAGVETISEAVESEQIARLQAWRANRDQAAVQWALKDLRAAAEEGRNIMEPSIACAKAGVTTGEWGAALRDVFGEYRAPTGIGKAAIQTGGAGLQSVREATDHVSARLGRRVKFLVGKPGLDGHSNGAEQIAVRARDCGFEVVYEGIRLTPAQIVNAALEESVHVVGLSILSGSHVPLVRDVMQRMRAAGLSEIPVVVGGIIPVEDEATLKAHGVAAIYTPKHFQLNDIMADIVRLVDPDLRAIAS